MMFLQNFFITKKLAVRFTLPPSFQSDFAILFNYRSREGPVFFFSKMSPIHSLLNFATTYGFPFQTEIRVILQCPQLDRTKHNLLISLDPKWKLDIDDIYISEKFGCHLPDHKLGRTFE